LRDAPSPVSDVNTAMPRDLGRIVKRALVKDPEHRYQTAKDVRNDLEALKEYLSSGAIAASTVSAAQAAAIPPTPAAARPRRNAMFIAAGAAVVAAITAVIWIATRDDAKPDVAASPPFENIRLARLTNTGTVGLTAVSADARYVVHVGFEPGGKQSLWLRQIATNSNVQIVAPDAVRYDGVSFSPDGNFVYYAVYPTTQNFSVVYQVPVLGGTPRKIIDDVDTPLAFSPDAKQFAFIRGYQRLGESALIIASADGTNERKVVVRKSPLGFSLNNVAWSPDGKTLLAIARINAEGQAKAVAIDVASGVETPVGEGAWAAIETVAWLPGGRGFVAAAVADEPDATMQIWHFNYPGGERRRITNDLNSYGQVSVSSDAGTMAAVQREGVAHLWVGPMIDPASARQLSTGTNRAEGTAGMSWTHDGRIVYSSNASGNLDIWVSDASGANPKQLTTYAGFDGNPRVTPDGKSIVFSSSRKEGAVWLMDLDGANQRPLITERSISPGLITPDSKWVYYTSFANQLREVWRMPLAGGAAERLTAHWDAFGIKQDGVFYHPTMALVALSPDGTKALGGYSDPERRGFRLGVFPLAGGTPTRLDILPGNADWTTDGKSVIYQDWRTGVPNLFRQPAEGGQPVQLTSFTDDAVINFAVSRDGKQLAMSRGKSTSDVVLIRTVK